MEGEAEANYAYYALHKFRWKPSEFLALDPYEQAFVVAAIDVRIDKEKKEAAAAKRKANKRK
ncbi:MAG: hypothetical protein J6K51_05065 [Clostridia bacterium]|nr:hypothetical protein [Clostridia bacterium]